ncbi:MAG: ComEA family DNA-binding protein, partial [Cyanobacteria bacterium REEB65]|nr:ComEA family DNA-binding protein [Cyanobacteria bacterium REEB65]
AAVAFILAADVEPAQPQIAEQRVKVDVLGSVIHPGLYTLPLGARIVDAIQAAGGPARNAALGQVELASLLQDGESIDVPADQAANGGAVGDAVRQEQVDLRARVHSGPGHEVQQRQRELTQEVSAAPHGKVHLNRASAEDLEQLPGVGPGLAARILDYRSRHGSFHSVDELREVSGIGDRRLERLRPLVTVD